MEPTDHFAVFRLPRKLRVDPRELSAEFLKLSREYHPDRFAGADAGKLAEIQRNSARVNDAYRVLKDPVLRAEHLLSVEGVERPEGEAKCPPDLLAEVFELREQMMEGDADAAGKASRAMLTDAESSLETLFAEYDEASDGEGSREVLERIRAALDRRKFVAGLVAEADRV
jgi:molecular chaperone HscB